MGVTHVLVLMQGSMVGASVALGLDCWAKTLGIAKIISELKVIIKKTADFNGESLCRNFIIYITIINIIRGLFYL